jgi:hypothetical protein
MADIYLTFCNNYGESRLWVIWDVGRDPNAPKEIFRDYLAPHDCTPRLTLYSDNDSSGLARYQRSDGDPTDVSASNGSTIAME